MRFVTSEHAGLNYVVYLAIKVLWLGKERCAVTWEKAENVPKAVIEEFENGTKAVVADHITPSGTGQTVHTLTVLPNQSRLASHPPSADRPVIKENEGCVDFLLVQKRV